jgi:benzoyl-CoA reductase/2-hydroxyglutaryl-CoA dehydratase subunit BcrC/BadD/HgdB
VFTEAGLNTEVVEHVDHSIWQKLLHNAIVNPVSALTGLTCRSMLDDEALMAFMRELCEEIVAVMRARGIPIIDEEDPFRPVIGSLKALGKNRPSMWQDLARGMRTEVDAINGAIAEEGERLGLSTPHCRAIVHFVHSRERQKLRGQKRASRLLEDVAKNEPEARARATRMSAEGGMSVGRVALETAPRLREMLRDYYLDLQAAADDPDRRVAWCSGMGPVELLRALGLTPYFPENHAALIGASRSTGRYIPRALSEGFSQFASSAMTSDIGAMLVGDSPLVSVHGIAGPPTPDVIVYNTNHGQSLMRWFEYYGSHFHVPVLGLHPPAGLHTVGDIEIEASVKRMMHLGERLEDVLGTTLDVDRYSEVVALSARAAELWGEILSLARTVPAPITYFDMLIHMAPMVLMRGTKEAIEYYELLKAEIEHRVSNGLAAVPGERFRFYWEGPPIWCALRPIANLFLQHQAVIVASTYSGVFALEDLDPDNPTESLARAYTGIFHNRSDEHKAEYLVSQFREFGVDAVVYHEGRTSPEHSNVRYGLEVRLKRRTGLPSLVLEADTHDLRLFSPDQLRNQLVDFIERQDEQAITNVRRSRSEELQSGVEP